MAADWRKLQVIGSRLQEGSQCAGEVRTDRAVFGVRRAIAGARVRVLSILSS